MTTDALDPGHDGTYPFWPRDAADRPLTSVTDAKAAGAGTYRPTGLHADGGRLLDLTPTAPDGEPIAPPTLPLAS
jgi:hypothetical protein